MNLKNADIFVEIGRVIETMKVCVWRVMLMSNSSFTFLSPKL
jgi:hypothetical protein